MPDADRLRIVYFGSGAFGLPTLRRLIQRHCVDLVVSQPDRPAGRHRAMTPTPIAELAQSAGIETFKPEDPNSPDSIARIRAARAAVFVAIAYGHKLSQPLVNLADVAVNLHGSLLPKYRGAAPVQWALINNECETGASVITLAQRMDAGSILAQARTSIDTLETAGELHDRLASLGPDLIEKALDDYTAGALVPIEQDESLRSRAPKLSKADATVRFDQPADLVRARIHGLTPWPGCAVRIAGRELKVRRVQVEEGEFEGPPGRLLEGGRIVCAPGTGAVKLLEVQPPGGRPMTFEEYARGHVLAIGGVCEST